MTGKNRENYNKNYVAYVNSFDPPTQHLKNCFRAFMVRSHLQYRAVFAYSLRAGIRPFRRRAVGSGEYRTHFLRNSFDRAGGVR